MLRMQTDMMVPCDHCGGQITLALESDGRGDRIMYTCGGCDCRWGWGMVLEHRGATCPLAWTWVGGHGADRQRGAGVLELAP